MPPYECDRCGACCQGRLLVEADLVDLLREPRLKDADRHWAGRSFDEVVTALEESGRCVLVAGSRPCPFLDADNRCSIYATRPHDCVAMQAGDEQCQQVRQAAGLPPLEPLAKQDEPCECERPGFYHSGVPGIRAAIWENETQNGSDVLASSEHRACSASVSCPRPCWPARTRGVLAACWLKGGLPLTGDFK